MPKLLLRYPQLTLEQLHPFVASDLGKANQGVCRRASRQSKCDSQIPAPGSVAGPSAVPAWLPLPTTVPRKIRMDCERLFAALHEGIREAQAVRQGISIKKPGYTR